VDVVSDRFLEFESAGDVGIDSDIEELRLAVV
jgi:hypothetical protein